MNKITPPEGKAFLTLQAKGFQYFRCVNDRSGYFWYFERPEANLTDSSGRNVGTISTPMQAFDHEDGSKIVSSKIIAWANPPSSKRNPEDNLWALFKAYSDDGAKTFDGVKYVQRIDTSGGIPSKTCNKKGALLKVPFSATYVFWK